jgi:hypothetical protein
MTSHVRFHGFQIHWPPELAARLALPAGLLSLAVAAAFLCSIIHWS